MKNDYSKPKWKKHPTLRHFKNGFKLRIHQNRIGELVEFLELSNLDEQVCRWDIKELYEDLIDQLEVPGFPYELMISFRRYEYALLFKLSWILCDVNDDTFYAQYMIRAVRKYFSLNLANQICSVQPMSGPASQIYSLRTRYAGDAK